MSHSVGVPRRLTFADRDKIRDHLLRLDHEDRRLRFCGEVGDSVIEQYSRTTLATGDLALGFERDGALRALGELRHEGDLWHRSAEIAITVEKPWQSHGLGTELMRELLEMAQNRSIRTVRLFCLVENDRMRHLARNFGGKLIIADGEVEADIETPLPSYWSLLGEALIQGQSLLQALWGGWPEDDREQRRAG